MYRRNDWRKSVEPDRSSIGRRRKLLFTSPCAGRHRGIRGQFVDRHCPAAGGRSFVIFDAKLAEYHFPLSWLARRATSATLLWTGLYEARFPSMRVKRDISDQRHIRGNDPTIVRCKRRRDRWVWGRAQPTTSFATRFFAFCKLRNHRYTQTERKGNSAYKPSLHPSRKKRTPPANRYFLQYCILKKNFRWKSTPLLMKWIALDKKKYNLILIFLYLAYTWLRE